MKYIIWTYDKCKKIALKYNTRKEFAINCGSAYKYAINNNILNEVCKHMMIKRKPMNYWTFEKCKEEAHKFNTRNEYRIKSGSSYDKALKNGWLNDICSHMKVVGNRNKRCIYACEFLDNSVYVGLTHNIEERQKVRNNDNTDAVTEHINKTNLIPKIVQLTNYIDVSDASISEGKFLLKYKENGWNILNKVKTGNIGGSYCRWSKEKCIEIAKMCKNKKEFYLNYRGAYSSSLRNNWLSEIYLIFNEKYHNKLIYKYDFCKSEALKYTSKKEFKIHNRGAYEASKRNGWHNDICKHMGYLNKIWTKEKCMEKICECNSKNEFRKRYSGAYYATIRNKWTELFDYINK